MSTGSNDLRGLASGITGLSPRRFISVVASVVVLVLLTTGGVAWAHHINNMVGNDSYDYSCDEGGVNGGTVCRTDNKDVWYYMTSSGTLALEADNKAIVRNMLASQYSPTDLVIHYDSSPVYSGSGETDIIYGEGDVPGSLDGITWCNDASPSSRYVCDQQYIRIEWPDITPGLTCHETGHAVGLLHGGDSWPVTGDQNTHLGCMVRVVNYGTGLGSNQIKNINIVY